MVEEIDMGNKKKLVKPRNTAGYALVVVNKIDTFIKKNTGCTCVRARKIPLRFALAMTAKSRQPLPVIVKIKSDTCRKN